ncbi:helix-turn-helix domain-containing protein [Streptomyces inhibens]|uniref:helix-turn-helix domain-containing protein n=1 Tax=Streptomyces inhibens TaxID=2293571 RepID=UPI00402ADE26
MTPAPPQRRICQNCKDVFMQPVRPGRPSTMCSERCKRASRRKTVNPPDLSVPEADMDEAAEDLNRTASDFLAAVQDRSPSPHLLHRITALNRAITDAEAAVVRRGRLQGDTWDALAEPASLSSERLRKKWTEDALARRLDNRRTPRDRATPDVLPPPRPSSDGIGSRPAAEAPPAPTHTPVQHLAGALSYLQRKTGQTLKETAAESCVSASHVSRILSGERLPSWPVVVRLAHACAGDLGELRDLWEAAQRPPDAETRARPPAPDQQQIAKRRFHTAIRALYLAAGHPDLWTLRQAIGSALSVGGLVRVLSGSDVPDWCTTSRLVFALHGRPADLRPIWDAAYQPPPDDQRPHLPAGAFG